MNGGQHPAYDLVLPTCNRPRTLRKVLPYYLAQAGLNRLIIVEDGPPTPELAGLAGPKIMVTATGRRQGAAAAKALGLRLATAPLVGIGEDDAFPGPGYYNGLARWVTAGETDLAGGRCLYLKDISEDFSRGRVKESADTPWPKVLDRRGRLLLGAWLPAAVLTRRETWRLFPPQNSFPGNGWREESEPMLRMWAAGLRVALDPALTLYHLPRDWQKGGGQHQSGRLRYELWTILNDYRFHRRNGAALIKLGLRGPASAFALTNLARRLGSKLAGRVRPGRGPVGEIDLP